SAEREPYGIVRQSLPRYRAAALQRSADQTRLQTPRDTEECPGIARDSRSATPSYWERSFILRRQKAEIICRCLPPWRKWRRRDHPEIARGGCGKANCAVARKRLRSVCGN